MGVRTWAAVLAVGALTSTLVEGVAHGATECTATTLPHNGVATALVQTAPGDILGAGRGTLLRWHNGELTSSPLPDGFTTLRLRGADKNGRAIGSIDGRAITVADGHIAPVTTTSTVTTSAGKGINQAGDYMVQGFDPTRQGQQQRYFAYPAGTTVSVEILVHADQFRTMNGILDDRRLVLDWAADDGHSRAATFLGGAVTLLALPDGAADSRTTAAAGSWIIGSAGNRSVAWDPSGTPYVLPAGFDAVSVNRSGEVAGTIYGLAALWSPDGSVRRLGWGTVNSIGDDGTILGSAHAAPTTWKCH
ncbi:hypothetical protein [Kutzneria buriramensis]|uniref:YD repeat-containing protein n=1 Tax=Kutzneria buriramensis TaxID=1045776 RepID=A0A3E0H7F2_9PSEU|nr:hypothetical protein [Kutzneria buriramensis]REH39258.1 hypothetical protein BCF44_113113 [Kutzneria buriramensis]